MQKQTISIVFKLPATVRKKKDWYVSSCPVLDVYSQGETKDKALNNLIEALRLFFISCIERGTLDQVLKDCGLQPTGRKVITRVSKKYESIDVSLPFEIPYKSYAHLCHA